MTPNPTAAMTEQVSASRDGAATSEPAATPDDVLRRRARAAHPSGQGRRPAPVAPPYYPPYRRPAPSVPAALRSEADGTLEPGPRHEARSRQQVSPPEEVGPLEQVGRLHDEDGSLVTEYGLLAVVAATVAGVVIQWASGGALVTLFNALLRHARSLVGA